MSAPVASSGEPPLIIPPQLPAEDRIETNETLLNDIRQHLQQPPPLVPMAKTQRTCDPHFVYPIWRVVSDLIGTGKRADVANIAEQLQSFVARYTTSVIGIAEMQRDAVGSLLDAMVSDGLLHMRANFDGRSYERYVLPVVNVGRLTCPCLVGRSKHDPYCYECHRAGSVLACERCPRVFHQGCVRPANRLMVPLLRLREPVPERMATRLKQVYDYLVLGRHQDYDIYAVGGQTEDPLAFRRCVRCRLLEADVLRAQSSVTEMTVKELNICLGMALAEIREWMEKDTFSPIDGQSFAIQPPNLPPILGAVLFRCPLTIDEMLTKSAAEQYTSLTEFHTDIMDVQHCVGVLRGKCSIDYETVKYMELEALFHLHEIARCADCYQYSVFAELNKRYFLLDCQPKHALAYGLVDGHCYWPAKVIRKVIAEHRGDGAADLVWYDLRFFGDEHRRALVEERHVVAMDDESAHGRLPERDYQTRAWQDAMEEMRYYGLRNRVVVLPTGDGVRPTYSFEEATRTRQSSPPRMDAVDMTPPTAVVNPAVPVANDDSSANEIIRPVIDAATTSNAVAVGQTPADAAAAVATANQTATASGSDNLGGGSDSGVSPPKLVAQLPRRSPANDVDGDDNSDDDEIGTGEPPIRKRDVELFGQKSIAGMHRNMVDYTPPHVCSVIMSALHKLNQQTCVQCSERSKYYCCCRNSYCSTECRRKHWRTGHRMHCKRVNQRQSQGPPNHADDGEE